MFGWSGVFGDGSKGIDLNGVDLSSLGLSAVDRFVLWYGALPDSARTLLSVAVGAAIAYVVFRIVASLLRGIIRSVIVAVLVFLITTVPGNMMLSQAYHRVEQQVTTSLNR